MSSFFVLSVFPDFSAEGDDGLKIERGIATERLKLLRLTAGLLLAVVFISAAPFSSACRRHLQDMVFSILTRAEAAVQFLIIAQARVIADGRGLAFDGMHFLQSAAEPKQDSGEALPTLAALRRRLNALRAVLKNLRRHGLRLLRRVNGTRAGCGDDVKPLPRRRGPLRVWPSLTDPIDRPPDKAFRFILTAFFPSSRMRAEGIGGWAAL